MSEYHCFSMKETKVKKRHCCIYCGQSIVPGETYMREKSIGDDWQDFAWHPECLEDQRANWIEDGGEFPAYSCERPEKVNAEVKT